MKHVIVIDLDDTLYDERQFVDGGLRTVATYMRRHFGMPERASLVHMRNEFQRNGRGKVFDGVLKKFGNYSKKNIRLCLSVYRTHHPKLRLYPDAKRFLKRHRHDLLYVVTDGNPMVQRRKAQALGLSQQVKKVIATWQYGKSKGKPSPYCFQKIATWERVPPQAVTYISDDPHKDFVRLKPLGFKTVRVVRGRFRTVQLDAAHEADARVRSFDELL